MNKDQALLQEIKRVSQIPSSLPHTNAIDALNHIHHITKQHLEGPQPKHDAVNYPKHYRPGTYEAINVIQAWKLNFALGNVVKYVCRAGLKDSAKNIEDLQKALAYLEAHIQYENNQR